MASISPQAIQQWQLALKLRKALLNKIVGLQAGNTAGLDAARFEAVDNQLEKFRLTCVRTIFLDFHYAAKEKTEEALWGVHTLLNHEYRQTLRRINPSTHQVERRKAEKLYGNFLRITQKFYKGYIQRLAACYDIPELKRAALGIQVEQIDADDTMSPVPAALNMLVLESCHATLLHLGDLCRYRSQARNRGSSPESALTYLCLARHLMPNSGYAFHQMAILNADQGKLLDSVYSFYRAWAVEVPHPNVQANLESKFNSLRGPHAVRPRNNPSAPDEALSTWFVKLHAYFYAGESFSQQKELEEEVMLRTERACRDAGAGATLLKMALVNMSAHDIASTTSDGILLAESRFWHFTLRFNALFILTLCRVVRQELEEVVSDDLADGVMEIPSVVASLLPILRVYCVWLAAHRLELIGASHVFGAVIPNMMQTIADVFTLIFAVASTHDNLATCWYLLAEDLELRGHRMLTGDEVPIMCRVYCDRNGSMKPVVVDAQHRLPDGEETVARAFDVLRVAHFLHEDETTPILLQHQSPKRVVYEYRPDLTSEDGAKAAPTSEQSSAQRESTVHEAAQLQETAPAEVAAQRDPVAESRDENHTEQTVISMLTPFLKPPAFPRPNQVQSPSDATYGLDGTPANGNVIPKQSYTSPASGNRSGSIALFAFPGAWDYTPKPDSEEYATFSAGKEAFTRASRNNSPRDSMTTSPLEDPFATPGQDAAVRHGRAYTPNHRNPSSASGSASGKTHRDRMLQAFLGESSPRTSALPQPAASRGPARHSLGAGVPSRAPDAGNSFHASGLNQKFSRSNSIYTGTPTNGIGLGVTGQKGFGVQSPTQTNGPLARHFHVGDSASVEGGVAKKGK
ncbi:Telomerase activating protein Est1 [Ophiocordyceps camponoti-floridani]|uniref:Nonsense-mediated mRNA decay factor n=1 Tax=Ophiocordyceps camponoti-floridani TaxID=2030778 RepID=A0A8H4Q4U2_9HYPO|nr:Telomerase activating protein Est1 [Ophiocordyceps camponoti-floridani]